MGEVSHDTILVQNHVGILIENPGIYPNMSAKENAKLKCLTKGISSKSYIVELLEEVGLSAIDKKKVKHLIALIGILIVGITKISSVRSSPLKK